MVQYKQTLKCYVPATYSVLVEKSDFNFLFRPRYENMQTDKLKYKS